MPRWTAEARERQRELIKTWQPWQYSTGARTIEGKARVSQNARLKGDRARVRDALNQARSVMKFLGLR